MKIKFLKPCKDKKTGEHYSAGNIRELDDARALEILNNGGGYAVEYVANVPRTAKRHARYGD